MYTKSGLLDLHKRTHRCYAIILDHLAGQSDELLHRKVEGFGFPTLNSQLSHIAGSELFWVAKLQDEDPDGWEDADLRTVNDLKKIFMRVALETREYLEELEDDEINAKHEVVFPEGRFYSSIGLVISHAITHGFHHKGQVAAMCRSLGCPIEDSDMMIGL